MERFGVAAKLTAVALVLAATLAAAGCGTNAAGDNVPWSWAPESDQGEMPTNRGY